MNFPDVLSTIRIHAYRMPASSRRQKISMILQFAPLIDQILVLRGVIVPVVDVECLKKCPAMVKVGLSRFQKSIGELANANSPIGFWNRGDLIYEWGKL